MSKDIFIYTYGKLPVPRQDIEDAVETILGDKGEVTGAGLGPRGANIDVEVFDDAAVAVILVRIREALLEIGLPKETVIDSEGVQTNLKGELVRTN